MWENIGQFFDMALAKIIVVFLVLLFANRRLPLYICLIFTSVAMGLWMNMGVESIVLVMLQEILLPSTLILALVIVLIVLFSALLKNSGRLESIVTSLRAISSHPNVSLALAPALIGLLPMPGGAVFSAPMVETAVGEYRIKPESKLAINYWFRHVPEFIWPLYPGFILSLSIFGLEAWKLTLYQLPLSVGAVVAGVLFVLPALPVTPQNETREGQNLFRTFFGPLAPIIMVLCLMFGLQGFAQIYGHFSGRAIPLTQHLSMTLALSAGIVYLKRECGSGFRQLSSITYNSGAFNIVLMVFAIMAFKGILHESHTINNIRSELQAFRISETLVIALLPLIAGLVTGIAVGFVGSSFPLVVTLIPPNDPMIPYVVLAYGFGFMGMMLSPVHLCFLVTQEYFHTNALDSYKQFWKPAAFLIFWIIMVFLFYRMIV